METFADNLLTALEKDEVGDRLKLLFKSVVQEVMEPSTRRLEQSLKDMENVVSTMRTQLKARDGKIESLEREVTRLNGTIDDLEQHGRRGSVRVFGVPEEGDGSTDDKILTLFNGRMKLRPPLSVEDIEVSHRLGKVAVATAVSDGTDAEDAHTNVKTPRPKPRTIIVKFASRRAKERVMKARKNLRLSSSDEDEDGSTHAELPAVYVADDLTKGRAKMAYAARELKKQKKIHDTWVLDCKIYVKDLHNRVKTISSLADLNRYQ